MELEGGRFQLYRCSLSDTASGMELFLLKEGTPLSPETARQSAEVVRLAVNLWAGATTGR